MTRDLPDRRDVRCLTAFWVSWFALFSRRACSQSAPWSRHAEPSQYLKLPVAKSR
jgi:hypothetical protein